MAAPDDAPPAPSDGGRRTSTRAPRRWLWPTLVVAGWCLLILAALLRPIGPVHADQVDAVPTTYALPGIQPTGWVEQQFTAREPGLSTVSIRFGTFGRALTCTLDTSLVDAQGAPVAVGVLPCASIPDSQLVPVIVTQPLADSAGATYRLRITMRGQPTAEGVTYFGGRPAEGSAPAQLSTPTTTPYALELQTEYGPDTRAAEQLGLVLDRIGDYGPPWHAPVAVVALVLASIALLAAATIAPRSTGIVLVVGFAVAKGILWSVVIPPFKAPDEPAHFAYAQFMAVDHQIPRRDEGLPGLPPYSPELDAALDVFRQSSTEQVMPPVDRADFGPAADEALRRLDEAGDRSRHASGNGPAAGYTPAYYVVPAVIHAVAPGSIDARLGWMRLWSVALGAVTVWASVMLGRRLFPGHDPAALLLGVAVALQPMLSQQTANVNNDALSIAMGAVCTWIAVALTDPRRSRWWAPAAGAAFGIGMLGKPLVAVFAPVLAIAWLIGRRRGARATPWWWEAGTAAAGFAVTYGSWWLYANLGGYRAVLMPTRPGEHTLGDFLSSLTQDSLASSRGIWVRQLWGDFGWVNRPLPPEVQQVILAALLIGVGLVAGWLVVSVRDARRARRGSGPWSTPAGADLASGTAVCFLVVAGTVAFLYVLMYTFFRQTGALDFVQGRYALLAMPALLALPVLVLRRFAPRLSPVVPLAVITCAMAVLNVIALGVLVDTSYL